MFEEKWNNTTQKPKPVKDICFETKQQQQQNVLFSPRETFLSIFSYNQ